MKALSRRTVLRGAGGIAVALPFLDAMTRPRRARAAGVAKRFIVFFSANGTILDNWTPGGTDTAFTFSPILMPLSAHRDRLLIMRGLNNEVSYNTPGSNGHDLSMGTMLSAMPMIIGPSGLGRADHIIDGTAGGPSIDQVIAKSIGAGKRFTSLALGVQSTSTILEPMVTKMSYRAVSDPIIPEDDPSRAFASLFGDTQATQAMIMATQKRRGTILDAVLADLTSVSSIVGAGDKAKLDAHTTSIRELEKQLLTAGSASQSCQGVTPTAPTVSLKPYSCLQDARPATCVGDFASIGKAQMDILALALACDLTRVATLQWSTAESTVVHAEISVTKEHHLMSHDDVTNADALSQVHTWYAQQFSALLDRLAAVTDADGQTLLDGSVVFWVNELSRGTVHDRRDLPYVLAGQGNGALRTGRYVHNAGDPHNKLFAALQNMFGISSTGFGDPRFPGVLTGLG
ncbi:MAG TPA: DUF1552 domain-containing protein [Polyangia bacterium]|jgi:hypothetical protein